MGKAKFTDETLVHKCSYHACRYNKMNFCLLPSIMIGEDGKCIYCAKNREAGDTDAKE